MNQPSHDRVAAFGDPTRRATSERVASRPPAVGELARGSPVSRPAVSRHLRVLNQAGLVTGTPDGARGVHRVDPRGVGATRDWLDLRWAAAPSAFERLASGGNAG